MLKVVVLVYFAIVSGQITYPQIASAQLGWTTLGEDLVQNENVKSEEISNWVLNETTPRDMTDLYNETDYETILSNLTETLTTMPSSLTGATKQTVFDGLCQCNDKVCLEPDEYIMINETVLVEAYNNATYNSSCYIVESDNCLLVCLPSFEVTSPETDELSLEGKYSLTLSYITITGLAISMLCLILHLTAFALVPDLRNIPGYCMACLCVSLFFGYLSFIVGFDDVIAKSYGPCVAAAVSSHFFLLSSLLWMNVMAYDVLRSLLNATGKLQLKSGRFSFTNFYMYCLYAWGVSLVFALAAVISDNVESVPENFKPHFGKKLCWFNNEKALLTFFAGPVFTVICMNVFFFGISAYTIMSNSMKTDSLHHSTLKRNLTMYVRLAVIMGISWVAGLLAGLIDAVFLWYIFVLFNTLQGLFIFLAFTCIPKVKKHIFHRFNITSKNKISTQNLYPTFRSYYSHDPHFHNATLMQKI